MKGGKKRERVFLSGHLQTQKAWACASRLPATTHPHARVPLAPRSACTRPRAERHTPDGPHQTATPGGIRIARPSPLCPAQPPSRVSREPP